MDVCVRWICVCAVLCVGTALRRADPLSKESYRLCRNWKKKRQRSNKKAAGPWIDKPCHCSLTYVSSFAI
jgi:hypothetical protein